MFPIHNVLLTYIQTFRFFPSNNVLIKNELKYRYKKICETRKTNLFIFFVIYIVISDYIEYIIIRGVFV